METVSFVIACKKYFGLKFGQTLKDFNDELKALTPADREELARLLPSVGYTCIDYPKA